MDLHGGVANGPQNAVNITTLKTLYLETFLGTKNEPAASIVAGEMCMASAVNLQEMIAEATGIKLPVLADTEALENLHEHGNLIVLGQFANNRVLERFYYRWYLVVDGMQPGAGGYVLETVHNPDALGINLIVIGASDQDGIEKAAGRFMDNLKKHGSMLPRLFEVELGAGKEIVLERAKRVLDTCLDASSDSDWLNMAGMNVAEDIGELAMCYLYTGDERFAGVYKRRLAVALREDRISDTDDMWRLIISWDLIEESPVFSNEDRLRITCKLWEVVKDLRPMWDTYVFSLKNVFELRRNHDARSAKSLYFTARYFWQYYGIAEMKKWRADVALYWKPQMTSFMAMEGTGQAIASLMPATAYALAENVESFLSRDILGRIAGKPLLQYRPGYVYGGNYGILWLSLAAHIFDKPEYLKPVIQEYGSMVKAYRFPSSGTRELGRSFWDGRVPEPGTKGDQTVDDWIGVMPLSRLFFEKTPQYGARNIPYKESFDFLVFRDPLSRNRQYLEIGGQNAGSYCNDSGNAIKAFSCHGRNWLGGGWWILKTARHVTGVSIVRNGTGHPLPSYVRVERTESTPDWGMSRSGYVDYNGTDWYRNIINVPDKWFLVVDEITAREPGDYVLENRWRFPVFCCFKEDDVVACQYGANRQGIDHFHLTGTGWQNQYMIPYLYRDFLQSPPHTFPRTVKELSRTSHYHAIIARRWAGRMEEGGIHVFANLFHGNAPAQPLYTLRKMDENDYFIVPVEDTDRQCWRVRLDSEGNWAVESVRKEDISPETTPQKADQIASDLEPGWQLKESARILSSVVVSSAEGIRYALGLADGRIRLLTADGNNLAEADMPGKIYALNAFDLDGDGTDELIAGSDTGGVRAFSDDMSLLWEWKPSSIERPMGARRNTRTARAVITGILPFDIDEEGRAKVLVMGTSWYVLDKDGKTLFMHEVQSAGKSWDGIVYETTFALTTGDVLGDDTDEIIGEISGVGDGGGSRLIQVWDGKARGVRTHTWRPSKEDYLWARNRPRNRFCGSALKAVVAGDFDGDGKDEFAAASDAYDLHLGYYDCGPTNRGVWSLSVGSGVNVMTAADLDSDGIDEMIVGTEMGQVQVLDAKTNRIFVANVDESVTTLAVTPGAAGKRIWAGTVNGKLFVLDKSGEIRRRGYLPGLIDHFAVSRNGDVLVTTSGGCVALYGDCR